MMSRRPDIAQLAEHLTVDSSSHQMVPGSIPGVRRSFPSRMRHTHFVRAIAKTCCCGREEPAIAKLSTPGLEPGASRLLAERSDQLSYARDLSTALFFVAGASAVCDAPTAYLTSGHATDSCSGRLRAHVSAMHADASKININLKFIKF